VVLHDDVRKLEQAKELARDHDRLGLNPDVEEWDSKSGALVKELGDQRKVKRTESCGSHVDGVNCTRSDVGSHGHALNDGGKVEVEVMKVDVNSMLSSSISLFDDERYGSISVEGESREGFSGLEVVELEH